MPSETFNHTGSWQTWNVPAGVTSVDITINGAGSGTTPGGRVTGKRAVNGNQVLKILVGQSGRPASGKNGGATSTGGGGSGGDGNNNNGGAGGGGATLVRVNTTSGSLVGVAGGAGGRSGDNGAGGEGGAGTGESGSRGSSGSNSTGAATGGTQSQGGNGGTSSSGSNFNGHDAPNSIQARGGSGGDPGSNYGHGGGGGGSGYRAGGGGQASSQGYAPGGGGGGGSNYTGGMTQSSSTRGSGGTGNGSVTITWTNPAPANQPPNSPTQLKINGQNESPGLATKSTGKVGVSARVSDPDNSDRVRMLVRYSTSSSFSSYKQELSGYNPAEGGTANVTLEGLAQNTLYYVRVWAQDDNGRYSSNYNSTSFWTNRKAVATLVLPVDNTTIPTLSSVTFDWTYADPDPADPQSGFELRWRRAGTITLPAGEWFTVSKPSETDTSWVINPGTFKGNNFYEWQVRVKDQQGLWGEWSLINSFFSQGVSTPPTLVSPVKDAAIDATQESIFRWKFVDPVSGDSQTKADIRYRPVGADDSQWVTILGAVDPGEPGTYWSWSLNPYTFAYPTYHYEWQVRTYDTAAAVSDWSDSGTFWTTGTVGGSVSPDPVATEMQGVLGCGEYRVAIYSQGGQVYRGEITPLSRLIFSRVRDDISGCTVDTNGFGDDCGDLLKTIRSWTHEIVVFRDGVRVWEGPITRITYTQDSVELEAKDVMAYVYRRILRQGFNDSYRLLDATDNGPGGDPQGTQIGLPSVVWRASQIIINALAPADPNILPYLTIIQYDDDATESRVVPDYSCTAWEQVDDLAATAGLDYTTVGRRIILNDTHRSIGRLPEMRDGDFSNPPVVTEYGMSLSNYQAVTNNNGVWGAARPKNEAHNYQAYGPVEVLDSAYGETAAASDTVLTPAALAKLQENFQKQAVRNISGRWPTPIVVRVPDNSTLNPEVNVGFQQLIPGVWIPLSSTGTLREVRQWQKLDSVTVTFEGGQEQVQVVMSPAPNGGEDPDADAAAEEQ